MHTRPSAESPEERMDPKEKDDYIDLTEGHFLSIIDGWDAGSFCFCEPSKSTGICRRGIWEEKAIWQTQQALPPPSRCLLLPRVALTSLLGLSCSNPHFCHIHPWNPPVPHHVVHFNATTPSPSFEKPSTSSSPIRKLTPDWWPLQDLPITEGLSAPPIV